MSKMIDQKKIEKLISEIVEDMNESGCNFLEANIALVSVKEALDVTFSKSVIKGSGEGTPKGLMSEVIQ